MLYHVEKQQVNIIVKKLAVYDVFKDDIRQLADLKQQMSQKMILLRSTVTSWRCAALSPIIFCDLCCFRYMRVVGCRP